MTPPQLDAGAARQVADTSAAIAADRIRRTQTNLSHDTRIQLLQEAELATKVACDMRTYAALAEADDHLETS